MFCNKWIWKRKNFIKGFLQIKVQKKIRIQTISRNTKYNNSRKTLKDINSIKKNCKNKIKGENNFGSVKYIEATLNNKIKGAIVFPEKTTHDENYLEFISQEGLREKLYLKMMIK